MEKEDMRTLEEIEAADSGPKLAFTDCMTPGITLEKYIKVGATRKQYPEYLEITKTIELDLESHVNPAELYANCAYTYNENLYITDGKGNIAYIDCEMVHTDNAAAIRKAHGEYKAVGGARAYHEDMDAGHFGISLGQHPSLAVEQDRIMNRYGAWRSFEQIWDKLSQEGHSVNIKAVFVEEDDGAGGTYSPFWCVMETIDGAGFLEYTLANDETQS